MTKEKMSRMVTGIVVAATLLLVVLFSVLIYQWITFGVLDRRLGAAQAEAAELAARQEELQEEHEPLHEPPSGQPIHFLPLFLALMIYAAASMTMTAIIPIIK